MKKSAKRPKTSKITGAKRTAAVLALLAAPTIQGAAAMAKVSRSTIFLWLKDETFMAELNEARAEAFAGGLSTLKGAAERAARVLLALLKSKNQTTRRLTACAILEFSMKSHEAQDIEGRVKKLEELLGGR